ncbi:MAG: ester cyclase [Bryobacteraceae bacterium]
MTNAAILERALDAFADPTRRDQYLDLYADHAALHGYAGVEPGRDGIRNFYNGMWAAFPDARVDVQEVLECGDRLIVRFEFAGTHRGAFLGIPGTGKPVRFHGITILKMENGKCVERWSAADFLAALIQIGAFVPGQAA